MAEFLEARKNIRPSDPVTVDGMANMGKPVPEFRRQAGYDTCKQMGLDTDKSMKVVGGMVEALERDKPYEAMQAGMLFLDLTGTYRLMSILLVTEEPAAAPDQRTVKRGPTDNARMTVYTEPY